MLWSKVIALFSASDLGMIKSMRYTEIAVSENMQKDNEFCRKYGILSNEQFKDVQLSDKIIADYSGFCGGLLHSMYVSNF